MSFLSLTYTTTNLHLNVRISKNLIHRVFGIKGIYMVPNFKTFKLNTHTEKSRKGERDILSQHFEAFPYHFLKHCKIKRKKLRLIFI